MQEGFVYTVKPLNKEHLGDARTQRFVNTVKSLNKEHLGVVMTLIIMTLYMSRIRCVFYSEDSSNIQRFVYTVKPLNKEHLGDVMTLIIMSVYEADSESGVSFIQRIPQICRGLSMEENL